MEQVMFRSMDTAEQTSDNYWFYQVLMWMSQTYNAEQTA